MISKLLSVIFILFLAFIGASRTFELKVGSDYAYIRADFPRFANTPWFEVKLGNRGGIDALYDKLSSKIESP